MDEYKDLDYISIRRAVEIVIQYCKDDDGTCRKMDIDLTKMLDELKNEPPAEVRPVVRGHWVEKYEEDTENDPYGLFRKRWYCSVCGRWQTYGKTIYCPRCASDNRAVSLSSSE